MILIIGNTLAGIGLFLTGIRFISNSFKSLTNRKIKDMLVKWTQSRWMNAFLGLLIGALTQSGTSAAFILIGMVSGGLVPFAGAAATLVWVELGTSLLVFLASIKMKLVVVYLLALSSVLYSFDKKGKKPVLTRSMLGVSLLLFGFNLIKTNAARLTYMVWVQKLMGQAESSFFLLFVLGGLSRVITQSSSAVTILVMPLTIAGIFSFEQSLLLVYGTAIGSAVSTFLLSWDLKGTPRQVSFFKIFCDLMAGFLMLTLLIVEKNSHFFLIDSLLQSMADSVEKRISLAFLILKMIPVITILPFSQRVTSLIKKLSPISEHESLSQLKYLNDSVLENPEVAFILIKKEQNRLIERLPLFLNEIRTEEKAMKIIPAKDYHEASENVIKEIQYYISQLHYQTLSYHASEELLNLQNRNSFIHSLNDTIERIVYAVMKQKPLSELESLKHNIIESLHLILNTLAECRDGCNEEEMIFLEQMTRDRGGVMEKIRKRYISFEDRSGSDERLVILSLTDLFQKAAWLVHENIQSMGLEKNDFTN